MSSPDHSHDNWGTFDRKFFDSDDDFMTIGGTNIGGKAHGLALIHRLLKAHFESSRFQNFQVTIPRLAILSTEVFDAFMERNQLFEFARSGVADERIAHAFQQAQFPTEYLGDLRALISRVNQPLAVRSSSLLEDALHHPFAGVYGTKMIPNNQPDIASRFRALVEAIKYVYASTFFSSARAYIAGTRCRVEDEKMAVIIQEVVGARYGDRFYPVLSGVARSFNYYPIGKSNPVDGVVNLALGLGKTIVDGGLCWSYCPAFPAIGPPFGSPRDLMKKTQLRFYAVNMGKPPVYDPIRESEYLLQDDLIAAEQDGNLTYLASTYDVGADRIVPGIGAPGARVLNFAPLLIYERLPLNELLRELLKLSQAEFGTDVEIEFAVTVTPKSRPVARFGFLQVRAQASSTADITVNRSDYIPEDIIVYSETVMGNGESHSIADIIYVRPEHFEAARTPAIAAQLAQLNNALIDADRNYLLIGFGRWGSSDPWLGIPVEWGHISATRVIVEAALPKMNIEMSQGSHFFHNLTSFGVPYFSIAFGQRPPGINWDWLDRQTAVFENDMVRQLRLDKNLLVRVDGRAGKGVIACVR